MAKAIVAPEEMLQVHRGDGLTGLSSLWFCLYLTINISEYDRSSTPEQSPEAVNGWHTSLLQNYLNGRGLNIDRRKLKAV